MGNWTAAGGPLPWARSSGCTLPTLGCSALTVPEPGTPGAMFCNPAAELALGSSLRFTCSPSLRSVGQCRNLTFAVGEGAPAMTDGVEMCHYASIWHHMQT